ncbi:MAG: ice-binding family protein [Candidatus Izemoplasmatales bacterium]|nr:ice-binding family protein [Candidatus Izemoplasmatales bacterium]
MIKKRSFTILKVLTFIFFVGMVFTLAACNTATSNTSATTNPNVTTDSDGNTNPVTTTGVTTTEPVNMDATLTDLTVNGKTVMGFNPSTISYVMVLSSGATVTPVVEAVKYDVDSSVVIDDAVDVTSTVIAERTTTVTVTTADELNVMTYTILFESSIAPVNLGTADDFVILAESGISTETSSVITGNIGVSPAAATYITGFSLILDSTGTFSTSSQIVGQVYASDYTSPTPSNLTTAISDMRTAYTDAAGRSANYTELYSGDLSGKTLTTGVYKFGTGVLINTDLTLDGNATDVWIFQIDGSLTQAAGVNIILTGGALAQNIIWQVADTVSVGTGAHFEGTILAMTNISFGTNSSINGCLYAQTAVTLDATTVTKP